MRRAHPQHPPIALTIAGSDSGGGAGIQADLKSMEAAGAFGTSVLTAVTAQNTLGVDRAFVLPLEEIAAQLDAVLADFDISAVKTGMLASAEVIDLVRERLEEVAAPLVVDPVMVATSGDRLLDPSAEAAYEPLIAAATLVTPNVDEAAVLTDSSIETVDEAVEAAQAFVEIGAGAALVKGGHLEGDRVTDVLVSANGEQRFEHPRIETDATHGSGCTLASTIAARLARGDALSEAVEGGLASMQRALRYPLDVGHGAGAVHHLVHLRNDAAKSDAIADVREIVRELVDANVTRLVPEVGMNVVGTTPFAEEVGDTAAVEGRITRTAFGVRPNLGVSLGASSHVARFVLAAREIDPRVQFGLNVRLDDDIEAAVTELGWPSGRYERAAEPADVRAQEGSTMGWGARKALGDAEESPWAIFDHGAHGKEPILKLLANDGPTLSERAIALATAIGEN